MLIYHSNLHKDAIPDAKVLHPYFTGEKFLPSCIRKTINRTAAERK